MKRKVLISMLTGAMALSLLSGCGFDLGGSQNSVSEQETSSVEQQILDYEAKLSSGEAAQEDYLTLANLYRENNQVRNQRDTYENCYRLYGNAESLEGLEQIAVNVSEESEEIQSQMERLLQNVSLDENLNEAISMLISSDWFLQMMPATETGYRNYYQRNEAGELLYVRVGYEEDGQEFTKVWYVDSENQVRFVRYESGTAQVVDTTLADGVYTGAFESWLCESLTGTAYHETGTFENGICVGTYQAEACVTDSSRDALAFWQGREQLELTSYTGDFGTDGITTLEQPDASVLSVVSGGTGEENCIVYGYDDEKSGYLFFNAASEEAADQVFGIAQIGLENVPEFTEYEVSADTEESASATVNSDDIQIRVYDSNLEWFDGTTWHTVGDVDQYIEADPFYAGEENSTTDETDTIEGQIAIVVSTRGFGKISVSQTTQQQTNTQEPEETDEEETTEDTTGSNSTGGNSSSSSSGSATGSSGSTGSSSGTGSSGNSGSNSGSSGNSKPGNSSNSGGSSSSGGSGSSNNSGSSGGGSSSGSTGNSGSTGSGSTGNSGGSGSGSSDNTGSTSGDGENIDWSPDFD